MSPAVKVMTRLGMIRLTVLMTVLSAFLSLAVAGALALVLPMAETKQHLVMSFLIPFLVTPGFSWLTALSMRDSGRARKAAFELARHDPLTGLFNRRALFEAEAEARALMPNAACRTALYLDIDHFKRINDTHGHVAGDAVLKHLAQVLLQTVRHGDLVARLGGEEFVVLMPGCKGPGAEALDRRLLRTVRTSKVCHGGGEIRYTISIGAARTLTDAPTERLLAEADAQLYAAKQNGRDRMCMSFPSGREKTPRAAVRHVQSAAAA